MKTKAFVLLLVGVLVLGGGLGGAFAGGLVLGKSQGEKEARSALPVRPTLGSGQQSQGQATQEQLQQQFQGQMGQDGSSLGFANRGGLTGTIEKVEGNTVTVNTAQGPLQAIVGTDTTIQMSVGGTLEDLTTGLQVTVVGQRGEDGTVTARSIVIGAGLFMGMGSPDQQSP